MTTVANVCRFLRDMAPLSLAESWDNVGLLIGDDAARVSRILTCLTLTPDVADEAARSGTGLVVTHHPLLFKPVQRLTTATSEGRLVQTLIRNGIAVYSPHTAYDNAATGINQQLAERIGLSEIFPLRPHPPTEGLKVVTFVPDTHLDVVQRAVWDAGAGVIGEYRDCSFRVPGTGTFFGTESTNPAVGQAGQLEQVEEFRVEFVCPPVRMNDVLDALKRAHPYEEPAIDVQVLKSPVGTGSGRAGRLAEPVSLGALVERVARVLRQRVVASVGDLDRQIERVGIACGAAGEFLRDAQRQGCEAFLTGEARFHTCLEARDLNVALIVPGHYATERLAMEELAQRLAREFPDVAVEASCAETDPVQYQEFSAESQKSGGDR